MSKEKADVIVIGGGVIGLSVAYYASLKGASVLLLEKGDIGSGSSYGNAGLIVASHIEPLPSPGVIRETIPHLLDPETFFGITPRVDPSFILWLVRFCSSCNRNHYKYATNVISQINKAALKAHLELSRMVGDEYEFKQRGFMILFSNSDSFSKARETLPMMSDLNFDYKVLSGEEIRAMEPAIKGDVIGGIHYRDDAELNPALFLQWLTACAEEYGARILPNTEVYGFRTGQRRVKAVMTTKGEFKADQVVLSSGAWIRPLGRILGVHLPVEAGKGISLNFSLDKETIHHPLMLSEDHLAVTPSPGRLRVSGVFELSGLDLTIKPRRVEGIHRAVSRNIPMFKKMKPIEIWRGLRPCTPDGLPILGRLVEWPNVLIAGGHDMKGLCQGPITGQYITKLLSGESIGRIEKALRPERF